MHFEAEITLSTLDFMFLILSTALIAAGGYIINDIYDITADKINKPHKRIVEVSLDSKTAWSLYYTTTFIGLGLGFALSVIIGKPTYFSYFVAIALALYFYSRFLKKMPFLGNILISVIVGLSLLIVGIFELIPVINASNRESQWAIFYILRDLSIFALIINLLRELVKDIEDLQGDHVAHYKTLPIVIGAKRTAQLTAVIGLAGVGIITWYTFFYLYNEKWAVAIVLLGVIAPLGYVCAQLWEASTKKKFSKLSLLLKIIMFVGICAIPIISYTLDHAF